MSIKVGSLKSSKNNFLKIDIFDRAVEPIPRSSSCGSESDMAGESSDNQDPPHAHFR